MMITNSSGLRVCISGNSGTKVLHVVVNDELIQCSYVFTCIFLMLLPSFLYFELRLLFMVEMDDFLDLPARTEIAWMNLQISTKVHLSYTIVIIISFVSLEKVRYNVPFACVTQAYMVWDKWLPLGSITALFMFLIFVESMMQKLFCNPMHSVIVPYLLFCCYLCTQYLQWLRLSWLNLFVFLL